MVELHRDGAALQRVGALRVLAPVAGAVVLELGEARVGQLPREGRANGWKTSGSGFGQ